MVAYGRRRHFRNPLDLEGQHQTTEQHLAHQSKCFLRGNAHANWHFDSPAFSQKQGDRLDKQIPNPKPSGALTLNKSVSAAAFLSSKRTEAEYPNPDLINWQVSAIT